LHADRAIKSAGIVARPKRPRERGRRCGTTRSPRDLHPRLINEKDGQALRHRAKAPRNPMHPLLLMHLTGFLPPGGSARQKARSRPSRGKPDVGGLVLKGTKTRKRCRMALPPGEGCSSACRFWMVSALKLQGRDADARKLFGACVAGPMTLVAARKYGHRAPSAWWEIFPGTVHISLVNACLTLAGIMTPPTK